MARPASSVDNNFDIHPLDKLLCEISDDIPSVGFEAMKRRLRSHPETNTRSVLTESQLEMVKAPHDIFMELGHVGKPIEFISNLLKNIGRTDLARKLDEYLQGQNDQTGSNTEWLRRIRTAPPVHHPRETEPPAEQVAQPGAEQPAESGSGNPAEDPETEEVAFQGPNAAGQPPPPMVESPFTVPGLPAGTIYAPTFEGSSLGPDDTVPDAARDHQGAPGVISSPEGSTGPRRTPRRSAGLASTDGAAAVGNASFDEVPAGASPELTARPSSAGHPGPRNAGLAACNEAEDQSTPRYDSAPTEDDTQLPSDIDDDDYDDDGFQQKKITLYEYQKELAEGPIAGHNCIICAPTGSGKTLTAAYICQKLFEKNMNKRFKCLFIVNIRNLIEQQSKSLGLGIKERKLTVSALSENSMLKDEITDYNIVVLTAQVLLNALKAKDVSMADLDLLIMDECHHTTLHHPYNEVMRIYLQAKTEGAPKPQILGLTASLGVGDSQTPRAHYLSLCANLDCMTIAHVIKNKEELLKHNPKPTKDQIKPKRPRKLTDPFAKSVKLFMNHVQKMVEGQGMSEPPPQGSQQYENWSVSCRIECEKAENRKGIIACEALNAINRAMMAYEDLRAVDALDLLKEHFDQYRRAEEPIPEEIKIFDEYQERLPELQELAEQEQPDDNKLLLELADLLKQLHTKTQDSRGILLTRTRYFTTRLVRFIKEHEDLEGLVSCERLTGQGGAGNAMTASQQQHVLGKFRSGVVNLLVATDVAQEGLDMPKCNYVIRYNFVSNEIGTVQSRGRARAKNSECYLIIPLGTGIEERERKNLRREHVMMDMLETIHKEDQRKLEKEILEKQGELWCSHQNQLSRRRSAACRENAENVEIVCRKCKEYLSKGSELILKGPSHYICVSHNFTEWAKSHYTKWKPKVYRTDSLIGGINCPNKTCGQKLGVVYKYNFGKREFGYGLTCKNIMMRINGELRHIDKWSKIPFLITEENIDE